VNILTVIAEMGSGGAEAIVAELTRDLVAEGENVTVASAGGWRADELGQLGLPTVRIDLHRAPARAAWSLRRQIGERDIDLVHAHNVRASLIARTATRGPGRRPPVVATLHGLATDDYPRAARVLRHSVARTVAVSTVVADRLAAAGYPTEQITVIENAVPPPPQPDRLGARAALGVPADAFVVVCLARLVPQKRHDLLVAAWPELPPHALLLIAGDGPTRADLEQAINAANLDDRVRLLGDRPDAHCLLAAADLCVLPTDWEGLPLSLLEAMWLGVPVVASAVPELVATLTGAAELVEPNSAAALAAGMLALIADPDRAEALGSAGRHLVQTRFSTSHMRAGYRRVYEEVLAREGASS
jgi:glycosyltransferase involved in cell wall biosynthesis